MSRIRSVRLPPPSMLVAFAALVLALGGDAVAKDAVTSAKKLITGKQIAPRTITAKNVKPGALTGAQIADGSVANADVARGTLTLDRFAQQAVASLRGQKGDPGQAGPQGAAGAGGPQGAAGAGGPQGERGPQGVAGERGAEGTAGTNAALTGTPAGGDLTGTYPNPQIAGLAVSSPELALNAVPANGSGTDGSDKVATNAIDADELGAFSVGSSELGFQAVLADDNIFDAQDGSSKVAADAIGGQEIGPSAVGTSEVADNTLDANDIAPGGVDDSELNDDLNNTVDANDIATGGVDDSELNDDLDNTVDANDIATGGVDDSELNDDLARTIDGNDIALGGVGTNEIANGGVTLTDVAPSGGGVNQNTSLTIPANACRVLVADANVNDTAGGVTFGQDEGTVGGSFPPMPAGIFLPAVATDGDGDSPVIACNATAASITITSHSVTGFTMAP